jgi:hypothetical protein
MYKQFVLLLFVCIVFTGCGNMLEGEKGPAGPTGVSGTTGGDGSNGTNGIDGYSVVKLVAASMPDCDTVTITVEKIGPDVYTIPVEIYGTGVSPGQLAPFTTHLIDVDSEFITTDLNKVVGNPPYYVVIDSTDGMYVTCN